VLTLFSIFLGALAAQERSLNTQSVPASTAAKSYGERIQAAHDHLSAGESGAARAELEATDLAARGFEWKHVHLALALEHDAGVGLTLRGSPKSTTPRVEPISTFLGHTDTVRALAFSPTGDRLASGGLEQDIRLWNARTGDPERTLVGHTGAIVGLVFSKDGARLVSGSADGNAIAWDLHDGRAAMTYRASGEALTAITWSTSNEWLATADSTLGVRVWNALNTDARFVVRGHAKPITSIAFSPDGKFLASASEDGSVRVVDSSTTDIARVFKGDGTGISSLVFEPDGSCIRISTVNGSLRRLDLKSGARIDASPSNGDLFWSLAQSPDGTRFATGSELGFVRIFDAQSKLVFSAQLSNGPFFALTFDATGSRLFAGGDTRAIHVFETDADLARAVQRASPTSLPDDEVAAEMKPLAVDALCRRVVDRPGLTTELYVRAENLARAASDRAPGLAQIQTTYGAAMYRQARYDEALATLYEAAERRRGWPSNLAFRAMALAKLDRLDEARGLIDRLAILLLENRWKTAVEERALLEEARSVVASARPAPK